MHHDQTVKRVDASPTEASRAGGRLLPNDCEDFSQAHDTRPIASRGYRRSEAQDAAQLREITTRLERIPLQLLGKVVQPVAHVVKA